MKKIYSLALCLFAVGLASAPGAVKTWLTSAGTNDWSEGTNWSGSAVPVDGDDVVITNSGNYGVRLANATSNLSSLTLSKTLIFTNWNSALNTTNVTIQSGGVMTLPTAFTNGAPSNNVYVVCSNLTVDSGGSINADGKGYLGGQWVGASGSGPGGGQMTAGGGYGGKGGNFPMNRYGGNPYGSTNAPLAPGSGGGCENTPGGDGGGAIRIDASGNVTVNGTITANGSSGSLWAGAGAGGGIYLQCRTLAGTSGIVRANGAAGGSGYGGGGGGGRIAVIYDPTAQSALPVPSVDFSAIGQSGYGGVGIWGNGDIGTLYFPDNRFLTETISQCSGRWIVPGFTNWSPGALIVSNRWIRFSEPGFVLSVTNDVLVTGSSGSLDLGGDGVWASVVPCSIGSTGATMLVGGNLTLTNGGKLVVFSAETNASTADYGALVSVQGDVAIETNSWIYAYAQPSNGGTASFRMRDLTISAGGGFNADAKGYLGGQFVNASGSGPGGGQISAGGGYGGQGGNNGGQLGGNPYGATNAPLAPGSGGGCGNSSGGDGGGAIRIDASGNVTVNGTITANGGLPSSSWAGGGSGGGIYVTCQQLRGATNSVVRANGGNGGGAEGGGGGGGRIAIFAQRDDLTGETPGTYIVYAGSANGVVRVNGGTGASATGTNGTFYLLLPGTVILIR